MTTQSTRNEPRPSEPGYRGSLPSRDDRLARPWILAVFGIFVLVFVLSFLGVPTRLFPEPTLAPLPSIPVPSASALPSSSAEASAEASTEAPPSSSAEASPSGE